MAGKKAPASASEQSVEKIADMSTPTAATASNIDESEEVTAEDQRWFQDMIILRRAAAELAERRMTSVASTPAAARDNSFYRFVEALGYSSEEHRNAAVRTLYDNNPERAASFFNMALRESSPESRRKLGAALIGSGLVSDAIRSLIGGGKDSYSAFSLLFLAAKAGEIQPLVRAIENHPSVELRQKLIGLLASTSENEPPSPLRKFPAKARAWNSL